MTTSSTPAPAQAIAPGDYINKTNTRQAIVGGFPFPLYFNETSAPVYNGEWFLEFFP